jgi:hypothetical protein
MTHAAAIAWLRDLVEPNPCVRGFTPMIESIMFMGIGFLFAGLICVAILPLVHERAVRLTMRKMEAALPQSIAEIQAGKDLLRAEFAMSLRRLEVSNEQLKGKTASQMVQLSRKTDVINRLKIDREAVKSEVMGLRAEIGRLQRQLAAPGERARPEAHVVSSLLRQWIPHRIHH